MRRLIFVLAACCAFGLARLLELKFFPQALPDSEVEPGFLVIPVIVISGAWLTSQWFSTRSRYSKRGDRYGIIMDAVAKALTVTLFLIVATYLFGIEGLSRSFTLMFFLTYALLLSVGAQVGLRIATSEPASEPAMRNVLILGSKQRAVEIIELILQDRESGDRIIGCLEVNPGDVGREVHNGIRVIGTLADMEEIIKREVVDEIIFAMPLSKMPNAHALMVIAEEVGTAVRIIPDWQIYSLAYHPRIASLIFETFRGLPTMALLTTTPNRYALIIKDIFDYVCALTALVILSPMLIAITIAIKWASPGPAIFRQQRCGLHGRHFTMYKFRTMVADAESRKAELLAFNLADGPVFKVENDPRIIPRIGAFLRRTSLDELPQLFNVLTGDMSIVGPRPLPTDEVHRYDSPQLRRLSMKPGLTCLWQTTPRRNEVPFSTWVKLDLEYIDNWSLWMDFKIILKTIYIMVTRQGM